MCCSDNSACFVLGFVGFLDRVAIRNNASASLHQESVFESHKGTDGYSKIGVSIGAEIAYGTAIDPSSIVFEVFYDLHGPNLGRTA